MLNKKIYNKNNDSYIAQQRIGRINRDVNFKSYKRKRKKHYTAGKLVAMISGSTACLVMIVIIFFPNINPPPILASPLEDNLPEFETFASIKQQPIEKQIVLQPENFSNSLILTTGQNDFPEHWDIEAEGYEFPLQLRYTIDDKLQNSIARWLEQYDPDFAVVVALDPTSGRILALSSHVSTGKPMVNLALSSQFPAASIFKIITAAAAMDIGKLNPNSVLPFNGKSTSLYKKNVFKHKNHKWTRRPTLTEAFAKSINTVFGRIGLNTVGARHLNEYANRFYFNTHIKTDVKISPSTTHIPLSDEWAVVEAASGYTNRVTLSPLHAATLAASVVNEGKLMRPYLIEMAYDEDNRLVYRGAAQQLNKPISTKTAKKMQTLMAKTIKSGTARRSFRNFFKGNYANIKAGGKTGTLSGGNLNGHNDWFVGYAYKNSRKIAFAILNVNMNKWKVKSHYLSRLIIQHYFDPNNIINLTLDTGELTDKS